MSRATRIAALTLLWLVPLCLFTVALTSDWTTLWERVGVPSYNPPFLDLRSITSGLKTVQHGGDPLVANPYDPLHRTMNYPRIWLRLFSWLGINDSNLWVVGLTFCVLYLICVSWLILQSRRNTDAFLMLIAGLSLAPLFAMERGNSDMLVMALVLGGALASNRYLRSGTFLAAAILKIFPVAALLVDAVFRPLKRNLVTICGAVLAFGVFTWEWQDLRAIQRSTPVSVILSFGMLSLKAQAKYMNTLQFALLCVTAAWLLILAWIMRPRLEQSALQSKFGELFTIFGGIYLFSFAIGSNWNYRLIFLLPTLPFVFEQARIKGNAIWGVVYVSCVLVAENSFVRGVYQGIPVVDVTTFILAAMIAVIFLRLLLERLTELKLSFSTNRVAVSANHASD